jgi:hypothetical protein
MYRGAKTFQTIIRRRRREAVLTLPSNTPKYCDAPKTSTCRREHRDTICP